MSPGVGDLIIFAGEIVEGFDLVKKMESNGTASGTPKQEVKIAASGTI